MRRILPWTLVGLVLVGATAGAGVGLATQVSPSPQTRVGQFIAATRNTGTTRFTYSSVVTSSTPDLRSINLGEGSVNFKAHSMSMSMSDRATTESEEDHGPVQTTTKTTSIREIWIGRTSYLQLTVGGASNGSPWIRAATFPDGSFGTLGALTTVEPMGALATDGSTPGLQIENRGHQTVGGIETTSYLLVVPTCRTASPHNRTGPTEIWVDGQGRVVQARDSMQLIIPTNPFGDSPLSRTAYPDRATVTSTIRLSGFGAPMTIAAPRALTTGPGHGEGVLATGHEEGVAVSHVLHGCTASR